MNNTPPDSPFTSIYADEACAHLPLPPGAIDNDIYDGWEWHDSENMGEPMPDHETHAERYLDFWKLELPDIGDSIDISAKQTYDGHHTRLCDWSIYAVPPQDDAIRNPDKAREMADQLERFAQGLRQAADELQRRLDTDDD